MTKEMKDAMIAEDFYLENFSVYERIIVNHKKALSEKDNVILEKDKALSEKDKEIAELKRLLGKYE